MNGFISPVAAPEPAAEDPLPADDEDPDDARPAAGGVMLTGVPEAVDSGVEAGPAGVIEIFTSPGWMPNLSMVDDTASDSAP